MKRAIDALTALVVPILALTLASQHGSLRAQEPTEADLEEAWIASLVEHGPSHASGGRPELGPTIIGNPTEAVVTLRVGLSYSFTPTGAFSEFRTRNHPFVRLSNSDGAVAVLEPAAGQVAVMRPGQVFEVSHNGAGYLIVTSRATLGPFEGPIFFRPNSPENLFRVESIERANILGTGRIRPQYRGAMAVDRGPATAEGHVNLVNVISLESYLRGVIVNESPAFFHVEALKAQATAARGFAVANIGRFVAQGWPFDIVDSPLSQVYRGFTSEHPNGNAAAEGTRSLTASHAGTIIEALFSSSMGGHTEHNEWIFNFPSTELPGLNPVPYLRGIWDGAGPRPDLDDAAIRDAFWTMNQPQTFDACERVRNRFARWRIEIPAATLKARLTPARVVVVSGALGGDVTDVEVIARMAASQRIGIIRVYLTTGVVDVRRWTNVRAVFGTNGPVAAPTMCPGTSNVAPNFVLNAPSVIERIGGPGTLTGVVSWGGGWGHNVGLSQFGAHGRGLAGQNFIEILKGYYTDVEVGSYPIDIQRRPGTGPPVLRQRFVAPTGQGTLEVRPHGLKGLVVHFNETSDLVLTAADLAEPVVRLDVTPHLIAGENVVQYNPIGKEGWATALVIVE